MAPPRTFAALIDQDSVVVLEYRQEKGGFRVVDTRTETRRFTSAEAVADAVVQLLQETKAKRVSLAIVLQHFGSFFHTLVLPPAADEVIRSIILREVQRSFNVTDPAIAFTGGGTVERRDPARAGGQVPRQVLIAGAPKSVIDELHGRLTKARVHVEGLTVIPEVFRRLYDSLDGSTEATAFLVCLSNGPHVAFFVNGKLELAIDPPLALEGEAPLDSAVIVDQLERGAIFLRQQARGMVATRLLLVAPEADYESLASTIEARTGMRVAPLGRGVGSPETVIAMGAVLAAREPDSLDLFPRAPTFEAILRDAVTGPSLIPTMILTAAAVAVFWCAMQLLVLGRSRQEIVRLQAQVERGLPAVAGMRQSAEGRERIAAIRAALASSQDERRDIDELMRRLADVPQPGATLDSFSVIRVEDGWKTTVFGQATGATGSAAMSAASGVYRYFRRQEPALKSLTIETSYMPAPAADSTVKDDLRFAITFVAPAGSVP
jgi:hypothetical protein